MAESAQQDINAAPRSEGDEATQWYREHQSDALRQVEARLNELATGYDALNQAWSELDAKEGAAHDALDTRELIRIERERARIESEAAQIHNGYSLLQNEKTRLERSPDPKFDDILNGSSQPSQMFLRVHRAKLENDPVAMRRLLFSHARATASGLKPDSPHYFKALEAAMGFDPADRSLDDFNELSEEQLAARNSTRRDTPERQEPKELTPEQASIARDLGITQDEYAASMKNPFSQASQAIGDESKEAPIEVRFEQEPTKKTVDPAKYKPGPSAVTLSKAEVELCQQMAVNTNRPEKEVLKEFAIQKQALHSGKSGYQLYADKMRSEGHR